VVTGCLLAGLAVLVWPAGRAGPVAVARIARVLPARRSVASTSTADVSRSPVWLRFAAIAAGLAVAIAVGSVPGVVVGVFVAVGLDRALRRLEPAAVRRIRLARQRALPATLDLLAVALRAGLPIDHAIDAVAAASDGPLVDDLRHIASSTRLGAGALAAWAPYVEDTVWGAVARAVRRSAASGSALATTFERVAADRREERIQRAESAARRASVLAMAPLGLCFLPAFICIGVIPVVIGLLSGALK